MGIVTSLDGRRERRAGMSANPMSATRFRGRVIGPFVVGALVVAALALAGSAFGAVTPRLVVTSVEAGPGQTLTVDASKQKADDPLARIQLFVPTGFQLNAPAPGGTVGTATARVVLRDSDPNHEQVMQGKVTAITPTDARVAYEGASCDATQHLAAWLVQLKGA